MPYFLQPHFKLSELLCTDVEGGVLDNAKALTYESSENLRNLAACLEGIRCLMCEPIIVNSAFRCKRVNEAVGGVPTSYHLQGLSADIRCKSLGKLYEKLYFLKQHGYLKELIKYPTFIHITIFKDYNYENRFTNS